MNKYAIVKEKVRDDLGDLIGIEKKLSVLPLEKCEDMLLDLLRVPIGNVWLPISAVLNRE